MNLLCQQPLADPPRVDLLDFCIERMVSRQEPPGVQSLCIKLAYQLTRSIPELQQELRTMLEIMEPELLVPAIRSVLQKHVEGNQGKEELIILHQSLNTIASSRNSPEIYTHFRYVSYAARTGSDK